MMPEFPADNRSDFNTNDHPIFQESILFIKKRLGETGLNSLQQKILERVIHSSGDFDLAALLRFSPRSCELGLEALRAGAPILTDTAMAAAAVSPMAGRTTSTVVRNVLEWSPDEAPHGFTRTSLGMTLAWKELSAQYEDKQSPIVLIGSSPTALKALLLLVSKGAPSPSLIVGMPVGFIGVLESKELLKSSQLAHIRLKGYRGGAAIASAVVNALLNAA